MCTGLDASTCIKYALVGIYVVSINCLIYDFSLPRTCLLKWVWVWRLVAFYRHCNVFEQIDCLLLYGSKILYSDSILGIKKLSSQFQVKS